MWKGSLAALLCLLPALVVSEEEALTTLTDSNIKDAVNLWIADSNSATKTYGSIDVWDTSQVTDMEKLFHDKLWFNDDISGWDVSNVITMRHIFLYAEAFDQDLSKWDVSNVETMDGTFLGAIAFNSDISAWDVSKVTNMEAMFQLTEQFNGVISGWNVANVKTMQKMFGQAVAFNQDLSEWDVSEVTIMYQMFWRTDAFNQDISEWNVSKVSYMRGMFHLARAFNQDISGWNLSEVTDIQLIFHDAAVFNQNLCTWGDSLRASAVSSRMFEGTTCPTTADPDLTTISAGPFCHTCSEFPEWQIKKASFADGDGVNSMSFDHGVGDTTTPTRVKIYGLPDGENVTSTDIADACYSNGGDYLGTLDDTVILGLDISEYKHNVADKETSFDFTFDTDIKSNIGLYYETELEGDSSKLATIRFCVMLELLGPNGTDLEVYNYAEYAFGYNATLNGTIVLADAFQVEPADPDTGGLADETFAVEATVCGPDGFLAGGILNQGESVHICVNSTSYPEASISGIDSLTYSAPFGYLEAIKDGVSDDLLTKFVAGSDCDGSQCIVKTQLRARFYPPDGFMNVSIAGKAILDLGGRRVLAKVVPGERTLQGETSQSSFSINVETSAFDTSAGTAKKGVATSIVLTTFAAASVRFF